MSNQQGQVEVAAESAEEDAAFLAEMKNEEADTDAGVVKQGDVVVAQSDADVPELKTVQFETKEQAAADTVVARKEVVTGYTEDEIREALAMLPKLQKALDTTNGTLGSKIAEQQRALEALQEVRQKTVGTLTADKMKRLSKEFPELADLLVEDLNDNFGTPEASAQPDNSQIEQMFTSKAADLDKRFAEKEKEMEIKALSREHKDWRQVASFIKTPDGFIKWNTPEFGKWVDAQSDEIKTQIVKTSDAGFLVEQLTAFKNAGKQKPALAKKTVIEDAVMPRGSNGRFVPAPPADEEQAAFEAEMRQR